MSTDPRADFPYQDPTLGVDQRADDLLSRMTLTDKVGLMFQPIGSVRSLDEDGPYGQPSLRDILDQRINHMNILAVSSARETAQWCNLIQTEARKYPLGIPVSISSDPRHAFNDNPATSFMAGPFSQWPEPLGFGAIGSADLVHRWADVVRREYVAVGIRVALHPQIDLATEPRWARQSGTFGEDVELTSRLAVAYVQGLQGREIGAGSVLAMAKHFPGGGPQKDGEDPHFAYGREQVYPGGRFEHHLQPFTAAIAAGVAQVMPYYGMPVGTELEEVGFGFNKQVITDLLRNQLGFDGVVCTDWGILTSASWGVEDLTVEERMVKALDAGVDQFGGESVPQMLAALVHAGRVSESRVDVSVRRLLRDKFRLGLFDNPFVDSEQADTIVGAAPARTDGTAAQAAAHTLLKNAAAGPGRLPLRAGLKIYVENLDPQAVGHRGEVVSTPDEADLAILRLVAPWEKRGEEGDWEGLFHPGSLAFPATDLERVRSIAARVPTVVNVYLDRPAILAEISLAVDALLVNFGASDQAVVEILWGEATPAGRLPFDIPSSMEAVVASRPDVPFDTDAPTYRFGYGLSY